MRILLNPIGILLANTLPGVLLLLMFGGVLRAVHPLLDENVIIAWWWAGSTLAAIVICSTTYAFARWRADRPVGRDYAIVLFLFLAAFLYLIYVNLNVLLPWGLPRWMVSEDVRLWPMRLLTPALAHAIMVLVVCSRKEGEHRKPWLDVLLAVAIPVVCWAAVQIMEPLRPYPRGDAARHAFMVFMILLVCTFLFFLLRAIYAMLLHRSTTSMWALVWKVPVAVLLPLIGLLLNNGALPWLKDFRGQGPFGDLAHPMFYMIAILNGMVVCIPDDPTGAGQVDQPRMRLLLFLCRSVGYSYVLYFFILFLPLLPFSLAAILGIGVGFLLLAPIMLFALQTTQLVSDVKFLSAHHSNKKLLALFGVCVLVIPFGITSKYMAHRSTLKSALDRVYRADLSGGEEEKVDKEALERVLAAVTANRSNRRMDPSASGHTPFLSPYYNWLVLDNLTLSHDKVHRLERIFGLGSQRIRDQRWAPRPPARGDVRLEHITAKAIKDEHGTWSTWVELEMKHHGSGQEEYATTFRLPPGCFIGGHYLWIEDRKEPGILAERKAAEWIYQQIAVIERRDPSLLRHVGPDEYELRVFPFEGGQTRRMGFEVLSKEPGILSIDSSMVQLGAPLAGHAATTQSADGAVFIPAHEKLKLPLVVRPTHRHFILDMSTDAGLSDRIARLSSAITDPARATIWLTNAYPKAVPATQDWKSIARAHAHEGGFFAGRAVQRILYEHMTRRTEERPMIILAADDPRRAEFVDDIGHLAFAMPEEPVLFWLQSDGRFQASSLATPDAPRDDAIAAIGTIPVRAWRPQAGNGLPQAYVPNDSVATVFLLGADGPRSEAASVTDDRWLAAQNLSVQWMWLQLHPEAGNASWRDLVRASFRAQVLSPVTAFIAVENEAQKNALLKKQEEVLNADAALDAGDEELQSMSEPELLALLIPIAIFIALRRNTAP